MKTLLLFVAILFGGCTRPKQHISSALFAYPRLLPNVSILEIGIGNQSDRNLWLLSGRSRMSLRYNVYKNNEVLASVSGLDTVPFQEHGGLYELSYLPSQSVNPLREQYILQFALTEDIWKDFDSGDEVQISLIVTIYDENRENSEAFEFPYVKLPMPTSSQMK